MKMSGILFRSPNKKISRKGMRSLDKKAYSVQEAAKLLSLGKTTVYELIWQNKLKCIKIGRKIIVPENAIKEFLEQNTLSYKDQKECEQLEASKTFETQTQRISNSAWIRR